MSEKLKLLLEKINQEGVKLAEDNARAIELKAKKDADRITSDARKKAQGIIDEAKTESEKAKETAEIAIRQASRDIVLSLKDDIKKMLNKIIASEATKAMSSEEIGAILSKLIENFIEKKGKGTDVKVLLKKEDLAGLKNTFISKLKQGLKEGIDFKASSDINSGFSISFDKGKSFFDFTDEALTEALSSYLNPELARLLK